MIDTRTMVGVSADAEALIAEARRRQRRRRWRALAWVGVLLLASGVAVVGARLSGGAQRAPAAGGMHARPGPAAGLPPRLVVWTARFRVEVISSRTGRLIRTLATDVALHRGLPTVAVSATGVVYFDDASGGNELIRSVPLAGGRITTVAAGRDPAVSPDGRLLAYVTYTDRTGRPEAIVVRNLLTGTQKTWAYTSSDPDISSLSWSPEGRHLAFVVLTGINDDTATVSTARVLDTASDATLSRARPIPLGRAVAWAGFLTRRTGVAVATGPRYSAGTAGSIVVVQAGTGRILRRLATLPGAGLATDNSLDGTEGTITTDRSGRYLLIAGSNSAGHSEIFWWTFGMPRPVKVTGGAIRAAWAP